jgi:hypothetical protein
VFEGLGNHVFESITPQKLSTLLRLGADRRFVSCSEVVNAAFSYLQFPKLRSDSAIREAIAAGAMKGVFGYASMASASGDALDVRAELVRVGRPTGADEIDLSDSSFVVERSYAQELGGAEVPEAGPTGVPAEGVGVDGTGTVSVGSGSGSRASRGGRLKLSFRVSKTELFDASQVLVSLSDESSELDVSMVVDARATEAYDRTWVRNAIQERLEEQGVDVEIELGDD